MEEDTTPAPGLDVAPGLEVAPGLDVTKPFTRAAGIAGGLSDEDLRSAAYRQVLYGVHVARHIPDTLVTRARAALQVAPAGAVLSHTTAARLWAGAEEKDSRLHVSVSRRDLHLIHDQVTLHRYTYGLERAFRHGLPVTSPTQTFIHMAVRYDLVQLVVLGDRLVRAQVTTEDELTHAARAWTGHGGRAARLAAPYVRLGAASKPETELRMLLMLAGLPTPTLQHRVEVGETRYYLLDLAYPWVRLAVEYDGRWHGEGDQPERDAMRRAELRERFGWTVIVVTADQLYETPWVVLEEVRRELLRLGVPVGRTRSAWRRYFGRLAIS